MSNHGVDKSLIAQQFEAAKEFFALPTEVKLQTEARPAQLCWTLQQLTASLVLNVALRQLGPAI